MAKVFSRGKIFLSYYKPYMGLLFADLFCALIVSITALLLPLCARIITQHVFENQPPDALAQIMVVALMMLGLAIVQTLCNIFVDYRGHMMGALMESDMRRDLFEQYQKLSFSFYDEQRTGQLMSRLTHDLLAISELYHHGPEDFAIAVLKFGGAFFILMTINVPLTLTIFLFLPIMAIYGFIFNRRMNAALQQSHERIGDVNAQVEDALAGIRVVQSFTNEDLEQEKFAHENARFVESRRAGYRSEAYFSGGIMAFTQLFTIAVIVFGGAALLNGSLKLSDLLTFLLYTGSLTEPILRAVNIARLYQEGITGFNRFIEIMELKPDIQDTAGTRELSAVQGHVEFKQVSFRYQDHRDYVIRDLSLDVRPGETVALVGTSGVGKTTLCSLIPRFYEVTAGEILLDGHNIRKIGLRSLRGNIGLVQQDVYLFAGTVAENICYGKRDAGRVEMIEAAQKANAHSFIMALPNGYDTEIGQRGIKLSGGQKQRLSLARVFLKNPPIIIFDEATSALDNESERAVHDAIEKLSANRTMFVIAHRLSTIRNAQRIIVLTENGIEEQGSHEELLAKNGVYANLTQMQLKL